MKKIKIAVVASAMLVSLNADQTINLFQGWNLIGTYVQSADLNSLNNSSVNIAWKYAGGKWQAFSSNATLNALIDKHNIEKFTSVNSGEGFWVNSTNKTSITFSGNPVNSQLQINSGWNLLTLTSNTPLSVDYFKNASAIWKWNSKNQKWAVYSSDPNLQSKIAELVKIGNIETFNSINPGEGFWVYAGSDSLLDLQTPPSIGFAYELLDKLNAIPLANADIYVDNTKVATTDNTGKFVVDGIEDGKTVTIKKNGFAVAYGVIKNGKVVVLTQKDDNEKVAFSATEGSTKVAAKGVTSSDGTVSLIASTMTLKQDITVSVIPFMSPSAAPALNEITINGANVPVDQLAIIGGAYINVEDSSGNLLASSDVNGTVNFSLAQSTILGDLEEILNGNVEDSNYQAFSANAFTQFNDMLTNGYIDIVVLQFENGKWIYKGDGKLTSYDKVKKLPDGSTSTYTKYKLETDVVLNSLAPTAFALKMNYLTGEATVCSNEAGFKMFDGSVVNKADSNSELFEWIDTPIPTVTVIGDESVVSGAGLTDETGCITVTYKVPFLKPTFNLALKKDGYYDTEVSCSVDTNGAECSNANMYKIPDTASIEGYVKNKVTQDGIDDALVTLVNPEVLSADKITTGDDNGTSYVEVGYMPNVTYTWTAVKYDDNGSEVVNKVIKSGKGNSSFAKLTESEVYDVLVKPFDNSSNSFDAKYLTGNWELRVKAEHTFTNTTETMVEEAIGKFDIDLLMTKLAGLMSGQISEKQEQVVVNKDGSQTTLPNGVQSAAIYGGFSLGFLYEYGAQTDSFEWQTAILGDASSLANYTGVVCNDYNDTSVTESSCKYDAIADKIDAAYLNVAKGDVLTYNKSLYPVAFNVKFMAQHFADLLNPDPACADDATCEGDPFIVSGFTLRTLFKGDIDVPTTDENYNTTYNTVTQYLASYSDISGASSVSDVLDTTEITLVGSSATAYMRQVITKDGGYYRINMIPPSLSGGLEIFAKAEGYKFNANTDIKLVNDLAVGKVSNYDLLLEPIDSNLKVSPDINITDFNNWSFSNECSVNSVTWQVVTSPLDINVTNSTWAQTVWGSDKALLPDSNGLTSGYVWFGDVNTGLFSDTGDNTSSSTVCGKAITPVIDLSNYSFPVLSFNSWFEVESVDVAKGQYDQMNIGFIIPKSDNGGASKVTIYNANGDTVEVDTDTYYPLESLNPEFEPSIQSSNVPYSSAGLNALPVWKDYKVSVDGLAGYKVKFVFDFNSKDPLYNGFRGWGVDSVKVEESMNNVLSLPPMLPEIGSSVTAAKVVR